MSRGLLPRSYRDHRRYDFHRTFKETVKQALGATGGTVPDFVLPIYANPNQNQADPSWPRPALPEGCTGFAQAHVAEADLKQPVDPADIYRNTLFISGQPDGSPATLEDSFKAATVYGVKTKGQQDGTAQRMAPYFEVVPAIGQDWFEAITTAAYANQRPVSLGTSWPPEFENVGADGIQHATAGAWVGGHDHCAIGKKTIGGVEYLVDISWNGEEWGDHGLSYFTRAQVNALMRIPGSDSLTSRILAPGETAKSVWLNMLVRLQILELVVSLYQRLKSTLGSWLGSPGFAPL